MSNHNGSNGKHTHNGREADNGKTPPTVTEAVLRGMPPAGEEPLPGGKDLQLVCAVGPYELDVLSRPVNRMNLEIVGQVTRADRIHEPVTGVSVVLFDADRLVPVDRTETDEMGEFVLAGQPPTRYFVALGNTPDAPSLLVWEGTKA